MKWQTEMPVKRKKFVSVLYKKKRSSLEISLRFPTFCLKIIVISKKKGLHLKLVKLGHFGQPNGTS